MALDVGDIISVIYRSTWNEQRILFTTTWRVLLTTSTQNVSQDLADIAFFFQGAAGGSPRANYLAVLSTDTFVNDVQAQRVWPLRSIYRVRVINAAGTGGSVANTGNIAGVFSLRTDVAGRSQVANKHVGPPPNGGVNLGAPTLGYVAGMDALAANLILGKTVPLLDTNQLSLGPVIYHRPLGQASPITNYRVSDRIGTMRSRTLRVGE